MKSANQFAEDIIKIFSDFFKENYYLILFAFFTGLFVYGYDIFNFTLSIDEEDVFITYPESFSNIHVIFNHIFHKLFADSIQPYVSSMMALIFLSFSAILTVNNLSSSKFSKVIFVTLFTSFPVFAHIQEHTYFANTVAFAVLLSVISGKLFLKFMAEKKYIYLLIPTVIMFTVYSTYRPVIFTFFMPIILSVIFIFTDNKLSFKKSLIYIFSSIVVLIIPVLFSQILVNIVDGGIGGYYESYIAWGKRDITVIMSSISTYTYRYLTGIRAYTSPIMFISLFAILLFLFHFSNKKTAVTSIRVIQLIFLIICFIGASIGVIITLGGYSPSRTLLTASFLFASLIFLYFERSSKIEQLIITIFVIWSIIFHATFVTKLFVADSFMTEADKMTAVRVLSNIYDAVPDFTLQKDYQVAFIGFYDTPFRVAPLNGYDVFGASFFSWDRGNPKRMIRFLKLHGLPNNIGYATGADHDRAAIFAKDMPVYPAKGSVALMDNRTVIVNFPYK